METPEGVLWCYYIYIVYVGRKRKMDGIVFKY